LAWSLALAGCARGDAGRRVGPARATPRIDAVASADSGAGDGGVDAEPIDSGAARIDADGDDDPVDVGTGAIPTHGHFVRVGRAPLALTRICDLTPFAGALFAAHANQPLGTDGATISRFDPRDAKRPFSVAFDWNRPGEPASGGGAGQGFLRVHAIGSLLFVPDADPPYNGFGLADRGTEGYVFSSDEAGTFAAPRKPHARPPASAAVLPRAYHVIDVIRFRGRMIASTGSVPPTERAWHGSSPGALHAANADGSRWTYEVDYPFPWQSGVWRLGYLVRFGDRLYAGIQDYDGREPNDYVVFSPPAGASSIRREDAKAVRVIGTAQTLRWYVDMPPAEEGRERRPPRLFWIAAARDGVQLRVTADGDTWSIVRLPEDAGRPTDVTRFRDGLVILTERRLLHLSDRGEIAEIAAVTEKVSPFAWGDIFCAAPLAVLAGDLYAGGQRDGALYRLEEGFESAATPRGLVVR